MCIFTNPSEAYEVEFTDEDYEPMETFAILPEDLEPLKFKAHDKAIILEDYPPYKIKKGDVGEINFIYTKIEAYDVKFGELIITHVLADDLEKVCNDRKK